MNELNKAIYACPTCQAIPLAPESSILSAAAPSASTKDISYEDI